MLKNYFKIAWRNLFRNKLHTSINLGGLIIGFTIGLSILLVVYGQFSFDNFHVNEKKLYQAYQVFNKADGEEIENEFSLANAPAYKSGAPGIDKITRFLDGGNQVEYKGRDLMIPVKLVDEDFFSMFSFALVKGNRTNPIKSLADIVISEDVAKEIFGNEDPIGKSIKISVGKKMQEVIVSAVAKNVFASSLNFDVVARIENLNDYATSKNSWNDRSHFVYVQLKDGVTQREAELQLKAIDKKNVPGWYTDLANKGARPDQLGDLFATRLLPLKMVHFSNRVNGDHATSNVQIITLMTVGLFIIFIACFNFININLANAFTRSREIGVRKCLGAAKWKLFVQLWSESLLLCIISFMISLLLINVFLHTINGIDKLKISLLAVILQPTFLLLALSLLLIVSLIAGGYPSLVMIRFKVVETLKGKINLNQKSILRSSFIVVQFVIACIMICCTYIIYEQFKYLQNADLGINKDYLISVPLHKPEQGKNTIEQLRTRLASDPHILSITGSNINIGRGSDHKTVKIGMGFIYNGKTIHTNIAAVDYDYLKTLGVKVLEGHDFDKSYGMDTMNNMIVSESAARQFNEKQIIGKTVGADSSFSGWHIVGTFPDFHLYTMEEELEPLSLTLAKDGPIYYCFIKTTSKNAAADMEVVKKEMALLEPGQDFAGSFVNENINNWYQTEQMMSVLFSIAAAVAIILSCSGLLAMVLLIIQRRMKEIGIRKVLGASVRSLSLLISKGFLLLVLIAVLISTPISLILMNKWLESFPYRFTIQIWVFVLVALSAFVISLLVIAMNTIRAAIQNPVESLRTE